MAALSLAVPLALGIGAALAPAALAAELTITDPTQDTNRGGLDIVSGVLNNGDYVMSGTVSFRKDVDGTVIVGLKARDKGLMRVVSRHQAGGSSNARLLDRNGRIACDGLVVQWNYPDASMTFSLPSTCVWKGNYGAVRPWYLTEGLRSAADVDIARSKTFVARGA
jgi:hypothetical protein